MATIEMKLSVKGVRVIARGYYSPSTVTTFGRHSLAHLTVSSVRLEDRDAELVELIDEPTLSHIEHAMRQWATIAANRGKEGRCE